MMQTAYEADVTVRITKILKNFKKSSTYIHFNAVPVHKEEHTVLNKINHYTMKAPETISPEPCEGEIWSIKGNASWENAKSYDGNYFIKKHHVNVTDANIILSKNPVGFKSFIADTPHFVGIGISTAEKLWKKFGSNIYDILKQKKLTELLTIKGLGEASAKSLITGFEKFSYLKYSKFFTEHEIPVPVQKRIYKFKGVADGSIAEIDGIKFDPNPVTMIKENPYSLCNFGMSFGQCDRIAKKHFEIKEDDKRRLSVAVALCLKEHTSKGHTIALHKQIVTPLRVMLRYNEDLVVKALSGGYDKRNFIIYPDTGVYQYTPTYIMENVVAKRLMKLHNQGETYNEEENDACVKAFSSSGHELEMMQKEAIMTSVSYAISCITGGAGTGKTTVLNSVLNAYEQLNYNIRAVALSGRAAMRMRQSINRPSSTIAKFLKEEPLDDIGDKKFLLVIDEGSMLDLPTTFKIIIHLNPNVRILLVGDPNQLPPIGAGNVLSDIVNSRIIKNTKLSIVKRQGAGTGIPEYSRLVNSGIVPSKLTTGSITFHETEPDDIANVCIDLYKKSPKQSRVVAPSNALVDKINALCQKSINPESSPLYYEDDGEKFFDQINRNDPVLFTQNNYDAGVQNGSLGKLISVEHQDGAYGIVQMDDFENESDEFVPLTKSLIMSLKAGYAMTLHKAQGSQFPIVIVALSGGSNLDRAWLYTAITRAELELHIVGTKEKMISAITKQSNASNRQTYLKELLK